MKVKEEKVIQWRLAKVKHATPERALEIIEQKKKELGWKSD